MTHTYWEVGRRIVEHEQHGKKRAVYGEALIERLALDLTGKFGRGFSQSNLWQMRDFYLAWPILQTPSGESRPSKSISVDTPKFQTLSGLLGEHQGTRLQTLPHRPKPTPNAIQSEAPREESEVPPACQCKTDIAALCAGACIRERREQRGI